MKILFLIILFLVSLGGTYLYLTPLKVTETIEITKQINESDITETIKIKNINMNNLQNAYFAGGCFWCMEGIFESQEGVVETLAGYAGGDKNTATYDQVSSGNTKHREGVQVVYDPNIISYETLAELFWTQIDPTDPDGQFADKGFHYTTAMFYSNDDEKRILEKSKKDLADSDKFVKEIATKILPFTTFFEAEEYHQDYYKKSRKSYNSYKKGSGRKDFIENNWKNKIKEIENTDRNKKYKDYTEEILSNAKEENIVLFFHADWCPTCKAFENKVLTETIPNNILILKVNYDEELELRKKYNIVTQTSFVLVDNKGNLRKRWIGSRGIDSVIEKIGKVDDNVKIYSKEELKARLTPLQYRVTQEGGTEPPFNNEYWDNHDEGIYVDIVDRTALFSSTDKFDSGTGWPSFTKPIDENFIKKEDDDKLSSRRIEVKSDKSHLGHVFEDGPTESGGLRYCINSAALDFISKDELKGTKYEKYLKLFDI